MPDTHDPVTWRSFTWTIGVLGAVYVLVLTIYVVPNIEGQKSKQSEDYTQRLLLKQATESEMAALKESLTRVERLAITANDKLSELKGLR